MAAVRLLEVDALGELVWETLLLTLARQVGKTWWLRDICDWRLEHGGRFEAEQLVLSTGRTWRGEGECSVRAGAGQHRGDLYKCERSRAEEIEFLVEGRGDGR